MSILELLGGKKFFIIILSLGIQLGVSFLGPKFGLSPEEISDLLTSMLGTTGIYLAGQSLADGLSKGATSHVARSKK